jgi:hypothetical protein
MKHHTSNSERNSADFECPNCGSNRVETRTVRDRFQYGTGPKAVELAVSVPFRRCAECGFEYTDSDAEDLRHEAVCHHLGLLAPVEILALRNSYGLTRADFAEHTRIGEASLSRWETGQLIQNPGNDSYLFLLMFPDNWQRLKERFHERPAINKEHTNVMEMPHRFRNLDPNTVEVKRKAACGFLRPAMG